MNGSAETTIGRFGKSIGGFRPSVRLETNVRNGTLEEIESLYLKTRKTADCDVRNTSSQY